MSDESLATLVAFVPSEGIGGGIERYCDWLLGEAEEAGMTVVRVSLLRPGNTPSLWRKIGFVLRSFSDARGVRYESEVHLLVCHPSLAVAALTAARLAGIKPKSSHVLFYGEDIWTFRRLSASILKRWGARLVTISTFSAGALTSFDTPLVLTPGIKRVWLDALSVNDSDSELGRSKQTHVLTVFRLNSAVSKGLPEILEALERIKATCSCDLIVAGTGVLPHEIAENVARLPWVSVIENPADEALARLYAEADVFVLATRTRSTPPTSGEGFGIVLVEAQLAGTPVVAPASGGSDDAFLQGLTGLKPTDESASALAEVLGQLVSDPVLRKRLGRNARSWARAEFDPDRRGLNAIRLLFGDSTLPEPTALPLKFEVLP
jgi:phosphatidylinositol alpha-1,6-mannosyltransferase